MRHSLSAWSGFLCAALSLGGSAPLHGQAVVGAFPSWRAEAAWVGQPAPSASARRLRSMVPAAPEPETRTHTLKGLLIGGLIGAAATTVFLIKFCGDPDTSCQADEVGRATLIIAVPAAAAGALIGSLVRTRR